MHIAISGNIGAGKTSLTKLLSKHYRWQAHYEEVLENPYLDDFYHEMERWSFNLQIYFLYNRFSQILEIQKLEINSDFLDLGSTQSETNVSNYVKNKDLRTYANLNTNLKDQNNINLEIYPNDIK